MADRILKLARPRKAASESHRYRLQVLDRAAQIMDCFGFDHKELSVSEIGRRTRMHKSTTHRTLMAPDIINSSNKTTSAFCPCT